MILAVCHPAIGGETEEQFWPEVNAFVRLDDTTRLFFLASWTRSAESPDVDGLLGAHLDVTIEPLIRRSLRDADWARERYLWVRVGYNLAGTLGAGPDQALEHRGLLEATARVPLPGAFWLVSRARGEVRDIDGDVSARFRYRLGVEREVTVWTLTMVPYAQAEVFYDTRFDAWSRQLYQVGVEVVLDAHWRIEPYYARQDDSRSSPEHVNAFGLALKLFY
jgi:Protein of unknown function (DUF2490)